MAAAAAWTPPPMNDPDLPGFDLSGNPLPTTPPVPVYPGAPFQPQQPGQALPLASAPNTPANAGGVPGGAATLDPMTTSDPMAFTAAQGLPSSGQALPIAGSPATTPNMGGSSTAGSLTTQPVGPTVGANSSAPTPNAGGTNTPPPVDQTAIAPTSGPGSAGFNPFYPANQAYRDTTSVADQSAASNAYNFGTAQTDAANNVAQATGAGGTFSSPAAQQNYVDGLLATSGFSPTGTPIPGATSTDAARAIDNTYGGGGAGGTLNGAASLNPTSSQVISGFPSDYDPSKPVQAQTPPTGPADYLTGGVHTSDLATANANLASGATGLPATAATGTPSTTTPATGTPSSSPAPGSSGTNPATTGPGTTTTATTFPTTTSGTPGTGTTGTGGTTATSALPIAQSQTETGNGGVALSPTTPDNALTNSTISPGPATDRFQIAQNEYNTAAAASEPQYQADLRAANQNAFGAGRGVSGMLRTSRGNIESDRQNTLATNQSNLLNTALTGSIGDAYQNIGIAQQQQGEQANAQQTAYNQATGTQQLADTEQQQQFSDALQSLIAGSSGDPAQLEQELAALYGGQAGASSGAASGLATSAGNASNSAATQAAINAAIYAMTHGG